MFSNDIKDKKNILIKKFKGHQGQKKHQTKIEEILTINQCFCLLFYFLLLSLS